MEGERVVSDSYFPFLANEDGKPIVDYVEMVAQNPEAIRVLLLEKDPNASVEHLEKLGNDYKLHGGWIGQLLRDRDVADKDGNTIEARSIKPRPEYNYEVFTEAMFEAFPKDLRDDLDEFWPGMNDKITHFKVLHLEWKKHGRCSDMVPLAYFRMIMHIRKTAFRPKEILEEGNIIASNETPYKAQDISDALKKAFGAQAAFSWRTTNDGRKMLVDIRALAVFKSNPVTFINHPSQYISMDGKGSPQLGHDDLIYIGKVRT